MRVWFVSPRSEHESYNEAEPGEPGYQYETSYLDFWDDQPLFATEEQAINERNKLFLEKYEMERVQHADRLRRYKAKRDAIKLMSLSGISPEDLFPYGIGDEPVFSHPQPYRIGYLEVIE